MKSKQNAIYAPGELNRVREKLGVNDSEAKRMAQVLGGEVGTERDAKPVRKEKVDLIMGGKGKNAGRKIDIANMEEEEKKIKNSLKMNESYPGDDPSVQLKTSYFERVKIDQYAGQLVFDIKNSFQVLTSFFSFFKDPIDYVNPRFVTNRMNEYFNKIEKLVLSARNLFPKSNTKRDRQLKRASPFVYKVLDVIRNWNIEQLASNIANLQSHPRSITVVNFTDTLKGIYKPLFILEDMNTENIKTVFKLIYKVLYIESPMDAKEKYQDIIRNIIASIVDIRRDVQFGLYPMLMKLISDRFIVYERFFIERRRCYMAFLGVTEQDQLKSSNLDIQQIESVDVETLQENLNKEPDENTETETADNPAAEAPDDPKVIARRAKEEFEKAENRAMERGLAAMEVLFPKAGWDKLNAFPDLYPYFARVYNIKRGYELIAPTDSLHQIAILMHIMEDMFIGMRYVKFSGISGPDGNMQSVNDELGDLINNWRSYIDNSFAKEYLPRLMEYCRMLENSEDSRVTVYAKKNMNELHWIKRLYFLPYYKFESLAPPPFQKQNITPIYSQIRKLRKYLTSIAIGIEQGTRAGGAAVKAPCEGIINPWESYNFQIPNPVSRRLDILLAPEKRINATLIFFSLSAVTVLDYIINNENSWSYPTGRPGPLFRSVKDEGITPLFGVDTKIDADQIFKDSLKKG